jgi:AcrR family transcriptional regulator
MNMALSQMAEKKRTYELKERARKQAETRQRIVEATAELHEEVGPAATTVAEIARRAGVQRLTVYNHFPDERELFGACSAHFIERTPPPDPASWATIEDPAKRLRKALADLHAWYRAARRMLAHTERDAARMPALRAVIEAGRTPFDRAVRELLGAGRPSSRRLEGAIGLATSFTAWERLVEREGLGADDAIEVLAGVVEFAARR